MIGCGTISKAYLNAGQHFSQFAVVLCADLIPEAAERRANEYQLRAAPVDEVLSDPTIEIILNLTTPQSHAAISKAALEAGKHVYLEKPLALATEEARPLFTIAEKVGRRIACAPDTVLGAGQQTARKLIDDGQIGRPLGGTAFFYSAGPESWHPNADFLYQRGAGPIFDMGPYYLTTLVNMLGPIERVYAAGQISRAERTIGSGPRVGERFKVEVLTFVGALLLFESGAAVHLGMSYDIAAHDHKPIEIYGTEGCVQVPDPNTFGGNVRFARLGEWWKDIPHTYGYGERDWRGIGLAEMVESLRQGVPHRTPAAVAFHVLEVMEAITSVAIAGGERKIESRCERPRALKPRREVVELT
jgi:predicted dehydrogenase